MTSRHYAQLNGTQITGVVTSDGPIGVGQVELLIPLEWGTRPSLDYQPHLINNSVVWVDARTIPQAVVDKWADVRAKRDTILRSSDWRAINASDRGGQAASDWARSPWRDYRQALRDITNQADPFSIVWPAVPT